MVNVPSMAEMMAGCDTPDVLFISSSCEDSTDRFDKNGEDFLWTAYPHFVYLND